MTSEDSHPIPAQVSGIWTGQMISVNNNNNNHNIIKQSHTMVLSLTNNKYTYPSGFGAIITDAHGKGEEEGDFVAPWIVHGNWDHENNLFNAKLITPEVVINFTGSLSWKSADVLVLKGVWNAQNDSFLGGQEINGSFSYTKEVDDPDIHISGVWDGTAVPADELADFWIPSNPIDWSLSVVKPHPSVETPCVFGAGYFNDSGDVPDRPVLFFSLFGKIDPASPNSVKIKKVYEKHDETVGFDVAYDATLEKVGNGYSLKGKWENKKAGSFGSFSCAHE